MSSLDVVIDAKTHRALEMAAKYILSLHGISISEIDGNDHPNAVDARKEALLAYVVAKAELFQTGFKPETIRALDELTGPKRELAGLTIALRVEQAKWSQLKTPEA